jgi:hypothetical protein
MALRRQFGYRARRGDGPSSFGWRAVELGRFQIFQELGLFGPREPSIIFCEGLPVN